MTRANNPDDDGREYTAEDVEHLTSRADQLLDQLHEVLGEMADRLVVLSKGSDG